MSTMAKLNTEMSESMPATGSPTAVKSGALRDADAFHKGSGKATVYRLASGGHVLRLESLNVTNGPDLRVILSPHPNPTEPDHVTAPGYVELGKLKGNIGSQNYDIPTGVDVAAQRSVVIFCWPFRVIFSVAALE
ncbi:MAG: DM13 domain-containing protein [Chloroflexi bacterium]|nr:DM13 domain-containing protein [Chloroflexota bacterium]